MNWLSYLLGAKIKPRRQSVGLTTDTEKLEYLQSYYRQHIEPLSRKFENLRVRSLKRARQRFYLSVAVCSVLFISFWLLTPYFQQYDTPTYIAVLPLLILLPLGWWSFRPLTRFKADVKSQVYPRIFRYFGDDFIYSHQHHMSLTHLKKSKLLPEYDKAEFDDYVAGAYQGISIALNELKLTGKGKVGSKTRSEVRFKGIAIELGCHKSFKAHTLVVGNRGHLVNFVSDKLKGLERVKLEDPRFEKRFDVFSNDQLEARYLLTVSFMERLQALASSFSGKFECAFYQDKLLILLESTDNRFELGSIFKGASFEYEFSQINKEMKQVFAMIEVLKLNQYTGL